MKAPGRSPGNDPDAGAAVGPAAGGGWRVETLRKLIHVGVSLVAAGVVWWRPAEEAAVIMAAATLVALLIELARRVDRRVGHRFRSWLGLLLRPAEAHRLTGATTLALGYTLATVLLPGRPALVGILMTGIADALAAVVGKRFGSLRYPGGKSAQGSIAFFCAAFLLVWSLPGVGAGRAVAVAAIATVMEAFTVPMDDNLYLPLATAAAFALVVRVLAPQGFS